MPPSIKTTHAIHEKPRLHTDSRLHPGGFDEIFVTQDVKILQNVEKMKEAALHTVMSAINSWPSTLMESGIWTP